MSYCKIKGSAWQRIASPAKLQAFGGPLCTLLHTYFLAFVIKLYIHSMIDTVCTEQMMTQI